MKIARYLFVIVLTFVICFNLKITADNIVLVHKTLKGPDVFPGSPFLFLKPTLAHVYRAGYYSDYAPAHPDTDIVYAYNFQTAQFALAPTMLDHEHPWNYEYVVMVLSRPQAVASVLKHFPSQVCLYNGSVIFAFHRPKL